MPRYLCLPDFNQALLRPAVGNEQAGSSKITNQTKTGGSLFTLSTPGHSVTGPFVQNATGNPRDTKNGVVVASSRHWHNKVQFPKPPRSVYGLREAERFPTPM